MKSLILIIVFVIYAAVLVPSVYAATSEVTWGDYKKFRDIDEGNEGRKSFRERTFKNFEKHFAALATLLPEKFVLKIKISDIDLAGDTHAAGINRTRIVKDIYFPRINLSYHLVDENNMDLKSDTVVLKDMNFMARRVLKYRNKSLGYEKPMLDKWFKETFIEYTTKQ